MKAAEKVGFILLLIGLVFIVLAAWLAFSIFIGFTKVPQLIPGLGADPILNLTNTFLVFFVLIIITWVGSIISSRGVTLIKEVKLKVLKESFGIEAETAEEERVHEPEKMN